MLTMYFNPRSDESARSAVIGFLPVGACPEQPHRHRVSGLVHSPIATHL